MTSSLIMQSEVSTYLILADQLKAQYGEIDDETLRDTLEGLSDLPDLILEVLRSCLEDEALLGALKARMEAMGARLERFRLRVEKKRGLARWAMLKGGIDRLAADDLSVTLRQGVPQLEVLNQALIPGEFYVPQPARLDRAGLLAALKRGEEISGAALNPGDPHIQVRTR